MTKINKYGIFGSPFSYHITVVAPGPKGGTTHMMQQVKKLIPRTKDSEAAPQPVSVISAEPFSEPALIIELREWVAIFGGADGEEMSIIGRIIRLLIELLLKPLEAVNANALMGELDLLNEGLSKEPLNVRTYADLAGLKDKLVQLETTATQARQTTMTLSTMEGELKKSRQEIEGLLASVMEHKTVRNKLAELGIRGMAELDGICRKFLTESDRQINRLGEQTRARERATIQLNKAMASLVEVDAANANAQELEDRIRSLQTLITGQAKPNNSATPEPAPTSTISRENDLVKVADLEALTSEIQRISLWRDAIIESNAQYSQEKTELEEEIEAIKSELNFAESKRKPALQKELASLEVEVQNISNLIDKLVELEKHPSVTVTLRTLDRYKKALETVSAGVPDDLFNQELPAIPEITVSPTGVTCEPKPIPQIDIEAIMASLDPEEITARRDGLLLLAKACKVSPSELLIYTLYEALPCNHRGMRQRSIQTVVDHALRAGISPAFGFENSAKLLEAWHDREKENHKYLTFQGKPPAGGPVFRRSSVPLPWKVEQILTPDEVTAFQNSIQNM